MNITSSNSPEIDRITSSKDYVTTLTTDKSYTLSESVTITVDDTLLTDGYTVFNGRQKVD